MVSLDDPITTKRNKNYNPYLDKYKNVKNEKAKIENVQKKEEDL